MSNNPMDMSPYEAVKQWLKLTLALGVVGLIIAYTGLFIYAILTRHMDFVIGMVVIFAGLWIHEKYKEYKHDKR